MAVVASTVLLVDVIHLLPLRNCGSERTEDGLRDDGSGLLDNLGRCQDVLGRSELLGGRILELDLAPEPLEEDVRRGFVVPVQLRDRAVEDGRHLVILMAVFWCWL